MCVSLEHLLFPRRPWTFIKSWLAIDKWCHSTAFVVLVLRIFLNINRLCGFLVDTDMFCQVWLCVETFLDTPGLQAVDIVVYFAIGTFIMKENDNKRNQAAETEQIFMCLCVCTQMHMNTYVPKYFHVWMCLCLYLQVIHFYDQIIYISMHKKKL